MSGIPQPIEPLPAGHLVESRKVRMTVEELHSKRGPFCWYWMTDIQSGERCLVQVLHRPFPKLTSFRYQTLERRLSKLGSLFEAPKTIDYLFEDGLFSIAVYSDLQLTPPDGVDPYLVATKLFQDLSGIHSAGQFLGALNSDGICYSNGEPAFYDLSVAPFVLLAPREQSQELLEAMDFVSPDLEAQGPSASADTVILSNWLLKTFGSAPSGFEVLVDVIRGQDVQLRSSAAAVLAALRGEDVPNQVMPDPEIATPTVEPGASVDCGREESPTVEEDSVTFDHLTADYPTSDYAGESVGAEAGTPTIGGSSPGGAATVVGPDRKNHKVYDSGEQPAELSTAMIRCKLAGVVIAFAIVSFVAATFITTKVVMTHAKPVDTGALSAKDARARSDFEGRLKSASQGAHD